MHSEQNSDHVLSNALKSVTWLHRGPKQTNSSTDVYLSLFGIYVKKARCVRHGMLSVCVCVWGRMSQCNKQHAIVCVRICMCVRQ